MKIYINSLPQILILQFQRIIINCHPSAMEASGSENEEQKGKPQAQIRERYYKCYQKVLATLLTQFKTTINKFLSPKPTSIMFDAQLVQQCPSITQNISNLLDSKTKLKKQALNKILGELKSYTSKKIAKILFNMPEKESQYYQSVAVQSQVMIRQHKKKKKTSQLEWTGQKMLKLDIASIFFKFNQVYRKEYNIHKAIITRKLLMQVFEMDSFQLEQLLIRFNFYFSVIKYDYLKDFEEAIVLLAIVELKCRIFNLRKKIGNIKLGNKLNLNAEAKEERSIDNEEDQQLDLEMYFLQREDYQYRFCEIAYLPIPQSKELTIDTLSPYQKAQVKQKIEKVIETGSLFQQKREILKLKVKYRLSFFSLIHYFENKKENFIEQQQLSSEALFNLKICQWLFLKPISIFQALSRATKFPISIKTPYKNNSLVMIRFCSLVMERFSLLTNVLKAHENIDRVLKRKSIYVCRLYYFLSQFQSQYVSSENDQVLTLVIATSESNIIFAAIFRKLIGDYQFFGLLKSALARTKHESQNIVIYLNNPKSFDWIALQRLFSIRRGCDTRIYFATYPQHFQIHMIANFLIRLLISYQLRKNKSLIIVGNMASSFVISSLHKSKEIRELLANIYPKDHLIQDYSTLQIQFKEDQLRTHIRRAYQIFARQSFQKAKNSWQIWSGAQSLPQGRICYLDNGEKYPSTTPDDIFGSNRAVQQYLLQNSHNFVDKYVQQMKWRHPYLSQEQKQLMNENLQYFLQERRMGIRDLTQKLRYVVRFLICYQAYFNEMLSNRKIEQLNEDMFEEISFLKKLYKEQTLNLNDVYDGEIEKYCAQYFCVNLQTGERLIPCRRVSKGQSISEQQDPQNNKDKINLCYKRLA